MAIEWREAMSLGDQTIDADHKKIILLVNAAEKFAQDGTLGPLGEVLDRTRKYIDEHFAREEALMLAIEYPQISEHKHAHYQTKQIFEKIYNNFQNTKDPPALQNILKMLRDFLRLYFVNHVIKEDLKLKPFLQKKEPAQISQQLQRTRFAHFDKTVLIVDDIDFMRKQMVRILREAGVANLVEADEGGKAYQLLATAPELYGLVISDLDMNPTSGLHLLTLLRHDADTAAPLRDIPFIMLTSDDGKTGKAKMFEAGANGVIVKPFTGVELIAVTQKIIGV